jgi:hypothetical protein
MENRMFGPGVVAVLLAVTATGSALAQREVGRTPAAGSGRTVAAEEKKPVTLDDLARQVQADGLKGTMHGANHQLGTYVFTWWAPGSFFENRNFSLVPGSEAVRAKLATLERHQEVTVRGRMVRNPSSQPHILVEALEPGEKWNPGVQATVPAGPRPDLKQRLVGKKRIHALVHALDTEGGMLVVEYQDEVLPVVIPQDPAVKEKVETLYRGDRIDFRFRIRENPSRPLHLAIDPDGGSGGEPLVVTDAIKEQHGKERTVEGNLVLFPKSPALRRTIYGVEEKGPDGLNRYYTIFNFDDLRNQARTDAMLSSAWNSVREGIVDGRNKYIHTRVRVRVAGRVNNPAQNQANPTLVTASSRVKV